MTALNGTCNSHVRLAKKPKATIILKELATADIIELIVVIIFIRTFANQKNFKDIGPSIIFLIR